MTDNSLPFGWGKRNNEMSEHDMKLGGIAATKFASKNSYDGASGTSYKTSDQVRDFYLNDVQRMGGSDADTQEQDKSKYSSLPDFWEARQKEKDLQSKQVGVFSRKGTHKEHEEASNNGCGSDVGILSSELALIQIATHTLNTMTKAMENKKNVKIPHGERAAFAKAMKEAMDALAKQSS
jgi:hypothetical protein